MKKLSLVYIILAGVFWGTSGIFVHYLAPYGFSSMQMTLIRSVVSFLTMSIYAFAHDKKLFKVSFKELILFFFSGASFFSTASCYYYAMQKSSVSTAVVLMYTAPIFVMIYSVIFLGEKLTRLKAASVVAMIAGCGLVSGIIGGLKFDIVGIVFGLLAGISYSAYNIFTKIEMKGNSNAISANIYSFLFAGIIGLIVENPMEMVPYVEKSPGITIFLIIALGICTGIIPYFLYTLALRDIPAGTASSLAILEPMSATLFSVILLGEVLSISAIAGIILILSSVFALSKFSQ